MKSTIALLFACLLCLPTASTSAALLTQGNILVVVSPNSDGDAVLAEYTPSGVLVQHWQRTTSAPEVEGVAVDQALNPYAYLGQGSALIWQVNPLTGASSTFTFSGISMVGNTADGQLSAYSHYLYATDFNTGGSSTAPNGIVRFDLSNNNAGQRFFNNFPNSNGSDFDKVTVGLNGLLYGTRSQGGYQSDDMITSDAIAMNTPTVVRLPEVANDLAVDAAGDYFLLRDNGIDEYDPSFHLLKTLTISNYAGVLNDINLSANGTIIANSNGGTVLITNTQLTSYTSFSTSALVGQFDSIRQTAATLITPPVPEPASLALLAPAAAAAFCRRRRSRACREK